MKPAQIALSIVMAFAMLFLLPLQAGVLAETPSSSTGSITILAETYDGKPAVGAGFSITKIADMHSDNGSTYFIPSGSFKNYDKELPSDMTAEENLSSASDLVKYMDQNQLSGTVLFTDSEGTVHTEGLDKGLYLICQTVSIMGYQDISPFLVALPMTLNDGQTTEYDITARPKIMERTKPAEPTAPGTSGNLANSGNIVTPAIDADSSAGTGHSAILSADRLPQTGLLLWPIIALSVSGLILIILGWADMNLRRKRK